MNFKSKFFHFLKNILFEYVVRCTNCWNMKVISVLKHKTYQIEKIFHSNFVIGYMTIFLKL